MLPDSVSALVPVLQTAVPTTAGSTSRFRAVSTENNGDVCIKPMVQNGAAGLRVVMSSWITNPLLCEEQQG